jgi:hypothetical protein
MKQGRTVVELAAELERQRTERKDFLLDTRAAEAMPHIIEDDEGMHPRGIVLGLNGAGAFPVKDIANAQIADRLKIPKRYYDRMLDVSPDLLCTNINHWFNKEPEKRMIRTLDHKARAFLSERFRPLDNYELAEAVLPAMVEANCEVKSCEVTDRRMYIKAVTYEIQADVTKKVGDTVAAGVMVSNSEVGQGSLFVGPFIERLVCTNGMVVSDWGQRKYHVGRSLSNTGMDLSNAYELFTSETKSLSDRAFWMQVRDVVRGVLSQDGFEQVVDSLRATTERKIEDDPFKVIERVQKKFTLNDEERNGVLQHLLSGRDLTQWGLVNAITRTAEDVPSYDRATEIEALGWTAVQLPEREWKQLSTAA